MQWRGFRSTREGSLPVPLLNDLRELNRFLEEVNVRIGKLEEPEPISTDSGGGAALNDEPYVTIGTASDLTSERALTGSSNITVTDGGAGSTVTLNLSNTTVTPASYTYTALTVDAKGRITAASSGAAPAAAANPTASVALSAVNGAASTYMRSDAAPALSQSIAPTWTGIHTFTTEAVFNGGIDLGTSGVVQSNVADGASAIAYDMNDQTTRTQGYARELREGTILKEVVTWDGRYAFGYSTSLAPQDGHVLSFLASDSESPAGSPVFVGILAQVKHSDTAETSSKLYGMVGAATTTQSTGLSASWLVGVEGVAAGELDSAAFSSKYLAGVVGRTIGPTSVTIFEPSAPDTALSPSNITRGDWAHAAKFWADFETPSATKGLPTNRPAIASSFRVPIQGWSSATGEQWGLYGEAPTGGSPVTPAIAGFARIPFPARGTRSTHLYFIPKAAASGNPTGNAKGDVYFDDGTNEPEGLWEHDGTAWRYLINQHAYNADVTSTAATLGGIGASGPAAAAQGGWLQIKVDDGTAGGATVWIPWWV